MAAADPRIPVLQREVEQLRERVAWLERCLRGTPDLSYRLFGLSPAEERILAALMGRSVLSKEQLLTITRPDLADANVPEIAMVEVFVCRIRKKLKPFGINVTTHWGRGYGLTWEMKVAVRALVEQTDGGPSAVASAA